MCFTPNHHTSQGVKMLLFSQFGRPSVKSILRAQAVAILPHASRQAIAQAYTSQVRYPKPISLVSTSAVKVLAQSSFRSAVYQFAPRSFFVTVA